MSTPPQNLFTGDPSQISTVAINEPAQKCREKGCLHYLDAYEVAARKVSSEGNEHAAAVYRFLAILTGFTESFDTPQEPFAPLARFQDGRRSALPCDLSISDIEVVKTLANAATDACLRARLFDILWVLTSDISMCQEACRSYLAAAKEQNSFASTDWIYAVESFKRALQLGAKPGRAKPLFQEVVQELERATRESTADKEGYRACKLLRVLCRSGCGDPAELAPLAAKIAERAEAAGDFRRAKHYREVEVEWRERTGDAAALKAAKLAMAESVIKQAEARATGPNASALAASSFYAEGIEALRRAGAPKERVEEARRRLGELQDASMSEMKTFSTTFDISDSVRRAQEHVKSSDLKEAITKLVFGLDPCDPESVRKEVVENAQRNPLSFLVDSAILDAKGRPIARKDGMGTVTGAVTPEAMEAEMFHHAAQYIWGLRVSAFIGPGCEQIANDHHPKFDDLAFLVENNPFVPPGHEGILLRGIHAGFHGDWLVSTHLLVPQIENSIRYVLESRNVDVSNLMSDRTQPVKVLGSLLGMPETTKVFGNAIVFELRGILVEKTGYDLRNRVAHGFIGESECHSPPSVLAWWLVLRICLSAWLAAAALSQKPRESPSS